MIGNGASKIDPGVHLDAGLGLAEVRPREKRQRQIDRGGIKSIDRVVEFDTKIRRRRRVALACE